LTQELLGVPGLTFGGAGIWTLVALVVVWIIRIQPKMRELQNSADGSLRKDLMERIDKLEKQLSEERRECDREMHEMREEFRNTIKAMQQTIDGLHRQLLAQSSSLALRLTPASTSAGKAADALVQRLSRELDDEEKP
jgi:ElaB/YqjD/DUF883 family membrane-anchored ribosome-binding protein